MRLVESIHNKRFFDRADEGNASTNASKISLFFTVESVTIYAPSIGALIQVTRRLKRERLFRRFAALSATCMRGRLMVALCFSVDTHARGDIVKSVYKYNPKDYEGILGLSSDLSTFYELYEQYRADRTNDSLFALKNHWENLFFTIKHRELEGFLSPMLASETRDYLEELVNDQL